MHRIVCEDCEKSYDYDKEDFCPRCGAFNQPVKTWGTDSQGNVVRVDGVNEGNHTKSFVHSEVHREKAVRKVTGLDQKPAPRKSPPPPRRAPRQHPAMVGVKAVFWLIGISMLLSFITALLSILF